MPWPSTTARTAVADEEVRCSSQSRRIVRGHDESRQLRVTRPLTPRSLPVRVHLLYPRGESTHTLPFGQQPGVVTTRRLVGLGYHAGMSGAPGGSAGSGHGSDPDEEALLRRIREFLRHGTVAEAGVEEWGEFAAQLRFLREELPLEERQALPERWDRALTRALPDVQLAAEHRESVLLNAS